MTTGSPIPPPAVHDECPPRSDARQAITAAWLTDETGCVGRLADLARLEAKSSASLRARAAGWVRQVRRLRESLSPLDAFLQEYDLSSEEGVLLMCLAESLLRIPDGDTAERLIADKLGDADWERHLGESDSLFVNASTWGLLLTGRLVRLSPDTTGNLQSAMRRLVGRSSEPVIRVAIRQAMRLMGQQFVMGRTIGAALKRARGAGDRASRHSFDMLGEAALTAEDAARYATAYAAAIRAVGAQAGSDTAPKARDSISVKLSALHPRYEAAQRGRVLAQVVPVLADLARTARDQGIALTIDAEEADRLELSLDVLEALWSDAALANWDGLGLAVQAFQKRALPLLEWLEAVARRNGRRVAVRLVKGAYWDTEIKRAQESGLAGYPVFTRKCSTDVSYLACARRLLAARDVLSPQFATHNAQTVAAVLAYAGDAEGFEFQRLHGMGEALYDVVQRDVDVPCRVYAPVGSHEDLLPYLVRRLLENGANTSFVNRIFDESIPPEQLVEDPVAQVDALAEVPNPAIPPPAALFRPERANSAGVNLADESMQRGLARGLSGVPPPEPARSRVVTPAMAGGEHRVLDPADRRRDIGCWTDWPADAAVPVVAAAREAFDAWSRTPAVERAACLERAADAFESDRDRLLWLLVREAGKTLPDAVSEWREAVDFLRYYAVQARRLLQRPQRLPGPTGEHNELQLHGRGVFACISPWNFPLAIFTGQVAAALAAGNSVVAKPAEQTPLVADRAVSLLHDAGVPHAALQCVLGDGTLGAALVASPDLAGVAFTGSVAVARSINRALAARDGPIATLVAETGGQNAMIVDSSALPEQVVKDVVQSAFNAAGQRCSALRVLYLQDTVADPVLRMLRGAMRELSIGDPGRLSTDVGPVIDTGARERLDAHAAAVSGSGRLVERLSLPDGCAHGTFVAPLAVEIDRLSQLDREHFGPLLHVMRFAGARLEEVVADINTSGYGLTLGIHSRIESTWRRVQQAARVGNCYVNRNMIGAVVGVQPFGGEGRSGTGPKAGGPHTLLRFTTERTLTVNTAAIGGNATLLSQSGLN